MLSQTFVLTDCKITANSGSASKILEFGSTVKLKWSLNGIQIRDYFIVIYNSRMAVAYRRTFSYNASISLYYQPSDEHPIEQNRVSGYVNLVNGNGTMIFKLKNIQCKDSGVYTFYLARRHTPSRTFNVYIEVRGKKTYFIMV